QGIASASAAATAARAKPSANTQSTAAATTSPIPATSPAALRFSSRPASSSSSRVRALACSATSRAVAPTRGSPAGRPLVALSPRSCMPDGLSPTDRRVKRQRSFLVRIEAVELGRRELDLNEAVDDVRDVLARQVARRAVDRDVDDQPLEL